MAEPTQEDFDKCNPNVGTWNPETGICTYHVQPPEIPPPSKPAPVPDPVTHMVTKLPVIHYTEVLILLGVATIIYFTLLYRKNEK